MKYNPNIHHRRSIRLKGYDYSQTGMYFITICTQNRECIFGEIVNDGNGMKICVLNEYGKIAEKEWIKTAEIRPDVRIDTFVIMPNHLHGIIRIIADSVGAYCNTPRQEELRAEVPYASLFKSPSKNIGAIVRGYKASVTKQINILRNQPGVPVWQRNYYEHIIRDEESYSRISEYIKYNPLKWNQRDCVSI